MRDGKFAAQKTATDKNKQIYLTESGQIAEREIKNIESHYKNINIDKYIVMSTHIHMLIVILEAERINPFPTIKANKYDISNVVGKFKVAVTRIVGNAFMHSAKDLIWQKSFHDHIIRNEKDYNKIGEYIDTNVLRWEKDCFYISEDK